MVLWLHISGPYIVSINILWWELCTCIRFIQPDASLSLRNNDMLSHFKMKPSNYEIFQGRNFVIVYFACVNNALQNLIVKCLRKDWRMWSQGFYLKPSLFTHFYSKKAPKCHKILIQNKSLLCHHQSDDTTHSPMGFKRESMFTLTDDHITSRHMVVWLLQCCQVLPCILDADYSKQVQMEVALN